MPEDETDTCFLMLLQLFFNHTVLNEILITFQACHIEKDWHCDHKVNQKSTCCPLSLRPMIMQKQSEFLSSVEFISPTAVKDC